jgi:hypothetical protein
MSNGEAAAEKAVLIDEKAVITVTGAITPKFTAPHPKTAEHRENTDTPDTEPVP